MQVIILSKICGDSLGLPGNEINLALRSFGTEAIIDITLQ
jgi:hypothetical protein